MSVREVKVRFRTEEGNFVEAAKVEGVLMVPEWREVVFEGADEVPKAKAKLKVEDSYYPYLRFENYLGLVKTKAIVQGEEIPLSLLVVSPKALTKTQEEFRKFVSGEKLGVDDQEIQKKIQKIYRDFKDTFERYLQDLWQPFAALPFSFDQHTLWRSRTSARPSSPLFRAWFLRARAGDISAALSLVAARPHSGLRREGLWVRAGQARRVSPHGLALSLSKPGNAAPGPRFARFWDERPLSTYDTPPNRMARFAALNWLSDALELGRLFGADFSDLQGSLTQALWLLPLSEAKAEAFDWGARGILAPGYRDIARLWAEYQAARGLADDFEEVIALKRVDRLYEYWVLVKILEALRGLAGGGNIKVRYTYEGVPKSGVVFEFGKGVKLLYNKSQKENIYSRISLRPDFLLEVSGRRYVFDAKFGIDWGDISEAQSRKDAVDDAPSSEAKAKAADIVKMHAYKDAIKGVEAAFAVYPGDRSEFYPEDGSCTLSLCLERVLDKAINGGNLKKGVGFLGLRVKG